MSQKGDRRRGLTDDERGLWDTFTKPIKPLSKRPVAPPPEPAPAGEKPRRVPASVAVAAPVPSPKQPPPLAPLGRREKAKVAKGRTGIDARIDLHGHTQAEAHAALSRFVRSSVERDARLILVITGKSGVLRSQVPQWLALPDLRTHVVGFDPAAPRHGGEGALYVRLRRSK